MQTANVADKGYLGVEGTVSSLSPLLDPPHVNEHATLVTLFINAIPETNHFFADDASEQADMEKASSYVFANGAPKLSDLKSAYSPLLIKVSCGKDLVHDMDKTFEK